MTGKRGENDYVIASLKCQQNLPKSSPASYSSSSSKPYECISMQEICETGASKKTTTSSPSCHAGAFLCIRRMILLLLVISTAGNLNGERRFLVRRSLQSHLSAYAPQKTASASSSDASPHQDDEKGNHKGSGSGVRRSPAEYSSLTGPSHYDRSQRSDAAAGGEDGKAIVLVPHNLSIVLVKWYPQPAIRISWSFDTTSKIPCEAFQVMYHPINSKFRYIIEVPCTIRNVTIERLFPATEYLLTINVIPSPDNGGKILSVSNHIPPASFPSSKSSTKFMTKETQQSISSSSGPNVIRFVSPQVEFTRANKWKSLIIRSDSAGGAVLSSPDAAGEIVKSGELAVVLFVLSGWIFIIVIFVKKWGRIRGIETVSTYSHVTANPAAAVAASAFTSQVSPTSAAPGTMFGFPAGNPVHAFGSNAGSVLRSQKSRESDESSGSHDRGNNMHATASVKKKRLEDAIHQFMLIKNQQSLGQMRTGYGIYDQILIGGRRTTGVRSMESQRQSQRRKRRGSLEDRSNKNRSEGDLNQDVRMNRSAENLLRLEFS